MNVIPLEDLAKRAMEGDRAALNELVPELQRYIFRLAVRMLWNREDAEDATQEILIRTITRLASFTSQSRLETWVYRIAVNYLSDVRKSAVERMHLNFVRMGDDLAEGLSNDGPDEQEHTLLVEEVKIGCTLAMLQCLDRPHRLAYILGEILDLSGPEAADVLGIDADMLRKRLERARKSILQFMQSHCGLVSDAAACHCNRRVSAAVRLERVDPQALQFASHAVSFEQLRAMVRKVSDARIAIETHRSSKPLESSSDLTRQILAAFTGNSPMH